MPLSHKPFFALISIPLIAASAQVSVVHSQDSYEEGDRDSLQEYIYQVDKAAREMKESLEVQGTVFDIPVFGNERTDPVTLALSRETLNDILDRDHDGKPDSPELTAFMAENNFQVVVTGSSRELDNIDDDDFPDEKTAQIAGQGIKVDSYLIENLRIVAEGQIALLKKQTLEKNPEAREKLEALDKAIEQLKEKGLGIDDPKDNEENTSGSTVTSSSNEDDIDTQSNYIMMSELVLSGQLATIFDRLSYVLDETLKKASTVSGRDFNKEGSELFPESYMRWKTLTPEALQELAPFMHEWLQKNRLSAPVVSLEDITPVAEDISVEELSSSEYSEKPLPVGE